MVSEVDGGGLEEKMKGRVLCLWLCPVEQINLKRLPSEVLSFGMGARHFPLSPVNGPLFLGPEPPDSEQSHSLAQSRRFLKTWKRHGDSAEPAGVTSE